MNLQAARKLSEPRYQDIPSGLIPDTDLDGARVHVVAGKANGVRGPVSGVATAPLHLDVTVPQGGQMTLNVPADRNACCYVFEGGGEIGAGEPDGNSQAVRAGELAVLGEGSRVTLVGDAEPMHLLLLATKPIWEPVARYGPFVMTTQDEIRQAIDDFRSGALTR